jgi:hypothetical protein
VYATYIVRRGDGVCVVVVVVVVVVVLLLLRQATARCSGVWVDVPRHWRSAMINKLGLREDLVG